MASEVDMVARRYQNKFSWIAQKQIIKSEYHWYIFESQNVKIEERYINEHAVS